MSKKVIIDLKINTKDGVKSVGDVNTAVNTTLTTMREMEEAADAINEALKDTEVGTEAYEKLSKELIKVNTELKNQELALEALDHEQVASEMKSVVGGLTDMAGGLALVGVSGGSMEKIVQTFAKVEGASKIATGAIEGYQSMMKLSGTVTALLTTWQTALAAATVGTGASATAASVGVGILNAIMYANPVFLLIGAFAALAAAVVIFSDSQESAADAAARLNESLAIQKDIMASVRSESSRLNQQLITTYENELRLMEAQGASQDALEAKRKEIYNLKVKDLTEEGTLQTKLRDEQVGIYQEILKTSSDYWTAEVGLQDKFGSGIRFNTELVIDQLNKLRATNTANASENYKEEKEQMVSLLTDILAAEQERKKLTSERFVYEQNFRTEAELAEIEANKKAREDYKKRLLDERKALYDKLMDEIKRRKSANAEITSLEIEMQENLLQKELEIQQLTYGGERDALIQGAIKRELAANDKKFIDMKISEEEWMANRISIEQGGINNLLMEEQKLLQKMTENNQKKLDMIKHRHQMEAELTSENTDVINSNRLLAEVRYQKERDLLYADIYRTEKETDEDVEKKKLEIKKQYLQKEIDAMLANLEQERQLRTTQYEQDIAAKGLTSEKKKEIEAQYNSDIQQMNQETFLAIEQMRVDGIQKTENKMAEFMTKAGEWVAAIGSLVQQTVQVLQMAFDQAAEEAAARREDEYNADSEALKASFANKEISQTQFDDKMRLLNQKKEQQELAAKRKAFKQNKALAIVSAIMGTASAVISAFTAGASLGPAGVVMGPVMAGIAGALGAVQIGLIASQKFQAARGGIVPGAPSKTDSVDAQLAPGEAVINSESAMMFPQLISQINQAGGGISLAPEVASQPAGGFGLGQPTFKENREPSVVKAYVVESEMTDAQKKINRIERSAEF